MTSLQIPAEFTSIQKALDFIETDATVAHLCGSEWLDIRLACEEILVNIVKYAYSDCNGSIEIRCEINTGDYRLSIVIKDTGRSFNPLNHPEPNISDSAKFRDIGGLGIYLTQKVMDNVSYSRNDNTNIITLSKK